MTTAVTVAAGSAAALALPGRDDPVPSRPADGGMTAPFVLDEGTASDGPWTLVVTEQHCIERTRRYGQEGACSLGDPGRLQDVSSFRTEDGGVPLVVVSGPVQDGTSEVTIDVADRPPVQVTPVRVDGRMFFTARAPEDARITGIAALDDRGRTVASIGALPPPPP